MKCIQNYYKRNLSDNLQTLNLKSKEIEIHTQKIEFLMKSCHKLVVLKSFKILKSFANKANKEMENEKIYQNFLFKRRIIQMIKMYKNNIFNFNKIQLFLLESVR